MSEAPNMVAQMAMMMNTRVFDPTPDQLKPPKKCAACNKSENSLAKFKRCSRCQNQFYCGKECQTLDWPTHKAKCAKSTFWYDKYRKCKDNTVHEGKLELITWNGERDGYSLGWGASLEQESESLQRIFEKEFRGNVQKFFAYRPQAFRWTCCGVSAKLDYGCDHHGTGSQPCTCDFCRMGKPIPDKIYNEKLPSKIGLNLPRGPDPRSYCPAYAASVAAGRRMWNMDG